MRGFGARGWMRRAAAALLAVVLAVCAGSPDAPGGRPAPREGANSQPQNARTDAMRVALDPETGALGMPSAASPVEILQEPSAAPRVETLPNGMMILHHDGHFRNYSLAERDAGGRVRTHCAAGAAAAREVLTKTPADSVARDAYGREVR